MKGNDKNKSFSFALSLLVTKDVVTKEEIDEALNNGGYPKLKTLLQHKYEEAIEHDKN